MTGGLSGDALFETEKMSKISTQKKRRAVRSWALYIFVLGQDKRDPTPPSCFSTDKISGVIQDMVFRGALTAAAAVVWSWPG